MATLDQLRLRGEAIIHHLSTARRYRSAGEIARAIRETPDRTRRALPRLEDAGIVVGHDESGMTTRWGLAKRAVACPDCRRPTEQHRLIRPLEGFRWLCPKEDSV